MTEEKHGTFGKRMMQAGPCNNKTMSVIFTNTKICNHPLILHHARQQIIQLLVLRGCSLFCLFTRNKDSKLNSNKEQPDRPVTCKCCCDY